MGVGGEAWGGRGRSLGSLCWEVKGKGVREGEGEGLERQRQGPHTPQKQWPHEVSKGQAAACW